VSAQAALLGLLNLLWESTLLAAGLLALAAALGVRAARVRHALMLALLLKFLVPAVWVVRALEPGETALRPHWRWTRDVRPLAVDLARAVVPFRAFDPGPAGTTFVLALWGLGSLLLCGGAVRRAGRLARVARDARLPSHGRVVDALARAVRAGGRPVAARVALSRHTDSAFVWGGVRPLIVLPESLAEGLTDDELDAVLLHELAHVRRRDTAARGLAALVACLFWPHPLVWWLARQAERESEFACDQEAAARARRREDLARGLAKAVRFGARGGARLAPAVSAGDVARRLERIIGGDAWRDPAWRLGALLVAATVALVALAAGANPCVR
jgi:beta-lactamase regulating signal transducer with metallopeptidase domain